MKAGAGFDIPDSAMIGAQVQSLQNQINNLQAGGDDLTAVTVTLPEPATTGAGFAIYFRPHEKKIHKGCYGTFRVLLPTGGGINRLRTVLQPTTPIALTGTAAINGTVTVTGTSTLFQTEISKGDQIIINAQTKIVANVASNTSLTVTVAFSGTVSGQAITAVRKRERMDDGSAEITVDNQAAGQVEYEFPLLLEWNVPMALVRLVAWDEDGAGRRLKNPPDEPDVGTYLTTFNTPANAPSTLSSLSLTITQDDSRRASVWLNFTQPLTPGPVAIESVRLRRKIQGASDSTYVTIKPTHIMWTDDYFTANTAYTVEIADTVKTKPTKSYTWECRIKAIGGDTQTFTQDSSGSNTLDVPAKSNQRTHLNMVEGGAMLNSKFDFDGVSATTDLGKAFALSTAGTSTIDSLGTGVGGASIDDGGIQWDTANHRLKFTTAYPIASGKCCIKIRKQIVAGETYNLTFMIKATTGYTKTITCELYDHINAAVITGCSVTVSNYVITTSYTVVYALFNVDAAYTMGTGKQWIRIYWAASTSFETYIDNIMLERGEIPGAWQPGPEEAALDSSINVAVDTGVGAIGAVSGGMFGGDGIEFGYAGSFGGKLQF
jgi:hypothetical protein